MFAVNGVALCVVEGLQAAIRHLTKVLEKAIPGCCTGCLNVIKIVNERAIQATVTLLADNGADLELCFPN